MKHLDDTRARMIVYQKGVSAILAEMQDKASRKNRKRGGTARHRKATHEGAAKEYLRRVSVQQIYC